MTSDPSTADARLAAAALADIPAIELVVARLSAAHLAARVLPPGRDDARWQVDLSAPRFTVSWGDAEVSHGPVRLLGTWHAADGLRWSWANPQVSAAGIEDVRAHALDGPLAALAGRRQLALPVDLAVVLLGWLAWRHDWQPFAAPPVGDDGVRALLGVRLDHHHGQPEDSRHWCTLCGRHHSTVPVLVTGMYGAVCGPCALTLEEVLATGPADRDPDHWTEADATEPGAPPPCSLCGRGGPRWTDQRCAVCAPCVLAVVKAAR